MVVLIVIGMLTLAGFTFAELMFAERKASHSAIRLSQARAIAESGIELARQFSALDRETQDSLGGWYDNTSRFQGQLVADDDTAER